MCSRVIDEVSREGCSDDVGKRTLRDIIHDAREMFRISERLQWKERLRFDHLVVGTPEHDPYSPFLVFTIRGGRIFLFALKPDGSSCGIYGRPTRFGFNVPRYRSVTWYLVMITPAATQAQAAEHES